MSFIAMLLYAPRYCLTASAGFWQQSKDCMPSVSLRSTLFAAMAICDSHFRRYLLLQAIQTSIVDTIIAASQAKHKLARCASMVAVNIAIQTISKPIDENPGCMKGPQPLHFQSAGVGVYVAEEKLPEGPLARPKGNFHSAQIFCPCAVKRTRKYACRRK